MRLGDKMCNQESPLWITMSSTVFPCWAIKVVEPDIISFSHWGRLFKKRGVCRLKISWIYLIETGGSLGICIVYQPERIWLQVADLWIRIEISSNHMGAYVLLDKNCGGREAVPELFRWIKIAQFCHCTVLHVLMTAPFLVARWWLQLQASSLYVTAFWTKYRNRKKKPLIIKEKYFPEAPLGKFPIHFIF